MNKQVKTLTLITKTKPLLLHSFVTTKTTAAEHSLPLMGSNPTSDVLIEIEPFFATAALKPFSRLTMQRGTPFNAQATFQKEFSKGFLPDESGVGVGGDLVGVKCDELLVLQKEKSGFAALSDVDESILMEQGCLPHKSGVGGDLVGLKSDELMEVFLAADLFGAATTHAMETRLFDPPLGLVVEGSMEGEADGSKLHCTADFSGVATSHDAIELGLLLPPLGLVEGSSVVLMLKEGGAADVVSILFKL